MDWEVRSAQDRLIAEQAILNFRSLIKACREEHWNRRAMKSGTNFEKVSPVGELNGALSPPVPSTTAPLFPKLFNSTVHGQLT
ncbi:MAG: hypothetical protein KDA81_12075 [Planctomycetaceae bacterium]|nr:hypothetical protein [Planctomycetaceae bacterium]